MGHDPKTLLEDSPTVAKGSTPGCGEYSDIRIYSNIFRYKYLYVSYDKFSGHGNTSLPKPDESESGQMVLNK